VRVDRKVTGVGMSTSSSSNNRLQGPAIYAPRHVRERGLSSDRLAMAKPSTQADAGYAPEQAGAVEPAERQNKTDQASALEGLEEAIRTLIGLSHGSGKPVATSPRLDVPQASSAAPPRVQINDRPPQRSGPRRSDHDIARSAEPRWARLEPEIVPEPPAAMRQSGLLQQVMPVSLVIVFTAAVVFGLIMFSTSQPAGLKGAADRIAGVGSKPKEARAISEPSSRLVVEDQQAFANQPLFLAVRVEHTAENELLLFEGLAQGTTLSAGTAKSPSSWQVPYDKLGGLYLYAPKDFVGVINTTVDLLGPDKRLLDSRTMQLKWIARQPMPAPKTASPEATAGDHPNAGQSAMSAPKTASPDAAAGNQPNAEQSPMPAPKTASPEATAGDHPDAGQSPMPATQPIDAGEAAILIQKGRDFLGSGDISAARVAFQRLADAGNADAALALANTYNPDYLATHNFLGVRGDRAMARALYQRAKDLGSAEAGRFLTQMQRMQ
jgi:hypothetical protein